MKTLVWKEIRENYKWALLAMVVLGAAEYYAITWSDYGNEMDYSNGMTLCKNTFLTATTFGCIAAGLLLGLVQILPELKRDQWAALLHRPVSRGYVFAGKVIAGLLLYAVTAGLPFLFFVWLTATPGHFPSPFVPEMVKPGVADFCAGVMYYFAALALSLPRGWTWWRGLPLLAAIHATYFIHETSLFYVAVETAVLMSLVLLLAAWGLIYNQDRFQPRPWLGKVAFLAVAIFGVCGLGDLAATLSETLLKAPPQVYQRYELSNDGIPLLLTYIDGAVDSVKDLEGKTPAGPKYQPDRIRNNLIYPNQMSHYIGESHGWKPRKNSDDYREHYSYIGAYNRYQYPRLEQWFYLVKENSYVGYLPAQKKAFALLDARGFQSPSSKPEPFARDADVNGLGQDALLISDGKKLLYANLAKREIQYIPVPEVGPIYGIATSWARTKGQPSCIAGVALGHAVGIYDIKAKLIGTIPYHQDVEKWGRVGLEAKPTGDGYFLRYEPSAWIENRVRETMPQYLDDVNLQGDVLRSYTLPPLVSIPREYSLSSLVAQGLETPFFFFGTLLYQKVGAELGSERLKKSLDWQLGSGWNSTRKTLIWSSGLSVVLAGVAFVWARRRYFSRREAVGWAFFVVLFNLAGLLAFRFCADWPSLVACPSCAGSRPTESDDCPGCGKRWPSPEANGAEIFDAPSGPVLAGPIKN